LVLVSPTEPIIVRDARTDATFTQGKRIGRGSFGEVYSLDGPPGAALCVKIIRDDDGAADEACGVALAARVRSPNIVGARMLAADGAHCIVAMPRFAASGDVFFRMTRDADDRLSLCRRFMWLVAVACRDAILCGVSINDLKLNNVLTDESGAPHIADFGGFVEFRNGTTAGAENPATYEPAANCARFHLSAMGVRASSGLRHTESDLVWCLGVMAMQLFFVDADAVEEMYDIFCTAGPGKAFPTTAKRARAAVEKDRGGCCRVQCAPPVVTPELEKAIADGLCLDMMTYAMRVVPVGSIEASAVLYALMSPARTVSGFLKVLSGCPAPWPAALPGARVRRRTQAGGAKAWSELRADGHAVGVA
jgi:hypothetical protein